MEAVRMTGRRGKYKMEWVYAPVSGQHDLPVQTLLILREYGRGGGMQRNERREGTGISN